MDDWQGCLSPLCQKALQLARSRVLERGGAAITAEDFLLALLDADGAPPDFLRRQGVDLDELVRTVQCEQPIVTDVRGEQMLSAQLQNWLASARDRHGSGWLGWPQLLQTLACDNDRFSGKAYVAVLEQVRHWPEAETCVDDVARAPQGDARSAPVVITDSAWQALIDDLAVCVAADPQALVWLHGPPGSGKSTWLQGLALRLPSGCLATDLRDGPDPLRSIEGAMAGPTVDDPAPLLILDNLSPAAFLQLMEPASTALACLIRRYPGPILLASEAESGPAPTRLGHALGRHMRTLTLPVPDLTQMQAVAVAHQAVLERRWQVEITAAAMDFVARQGVVLQLTPGDMLGWLERCCVRLAMEADQGPPEGCRLASELEHVHRQILVALARRDELAALKCASERLAVEKAAAEVAWHERRAGGRLREVGIEDLRHEWRRSGQSGLVGFNRSEWKRCRPAGPSPLPPR